MTHFVTWLKTHIKDNTANKNFSLARICINAFGWSVLAAVFLSFNELAVSLQGPLNYLSVGANYIIIFAVAWTLLSIKSDILSIAAAMLFFVLMYSAHSLFTQTGAIITPEHFRLMADEPAGILQTFGDTLETNWLVNILTPLGALGFIAVRLVSKNSMPRYSWAKYLLLALLLASPIRLAIKQDIYDYKVFPTNHSLQNSLESASIFGLRKLYQQFDDPTLQADFEVRTLTQNRVDQIEDDLIVAFIMGESVGGDNISTLGYDRPTMPRLDALRARALESAETFLMQKGLSFAPASNDTNIQTYNLSNHPKDRSFAGGNGTTIFDFAKRAGFTNTYITPQVYKALYGMPLISIDNLQYKEINEQRVAEVGDLMILDHLPQTIPAGKQFYYIYTWANHAPFLSHCKTMPEEVIFPIRTHDINLKWRDEYDNGMRCFDRVLNDVIKRLTADKDRPFLVIMTGDHSVMLGQYGLRGHGTNMLENFVVPMLIYTNRPDHPSVKMFQQSVGTHYELGATLVRAFGVESSGGYDPLKQIYMGSSAATGGQLYMRLDRESGTEKFTMQHFVSGRKTSTKQTLALPFLAKRLDELK